MFSCQFCSYLFPYSFELFIETYGFDPGVTLTQYFNAKHLLLKEEKKKKLILCFSIAAGVAKVR